MKISFQNITIREQNACDSFYEVVISKLQCSRQDAVKILNTYIKLKVAKINIHSGHVDVKHGAFYEKDILLNALNY